MQKIGLIILITLSTLSAQSQSEWTFTKKPNYTEKQYLNLFVKIVASSQRTYEAFRKGKVSKEEVDLLIGAKGANIYLKHLLCQGLVLKRRGKYRNCVKNFNKAVERFMAHYESRSLDKQTGASEVALSWAVQSITSGSKQIQEYQEKEAKEISPHGVEWVIKTSY